ncbi:dimethyladenosine transferase (rRNA methylation) [Cenarchaeum symbiosum A]|uniref:Dimethyladenosine transferase (rRNA methylation) n=1 Tax=Cenarchaeum symbiosum (strain A) TaxID=414004 RepID=A0RUT6_CENSY|nr:dimethyladenosine transferase (rRNA methylation) [Cenarchaeum symbiosum A]
MRSRQAARRIADSAGISPGDTVLEVGTGLGALTRELCGRGARIISVERNGRLYGEASASLHCEGLELRRGDGFAVEDGFDVFVSNLPYSQSRRAVEWLVQRDFARGIVTVQKEFAAKLMEADPRRRRAIGVLAGHCFEMRVLFPVARSCFDPPPRVDSVVVELAKRRTIPGGVVRAVNGIFSYRRKTMRGIMKQFGREGGPGRLDDLSGDEIVGVAAEIAR